jgi:hypothetical protein
MIPDEVFQTAGCFGSLTNRTDLCTTLPLQVFGVCMSKVFIAATLQVDGGVSTFPDQWSVHAT